MSDKEIKISLIERLRNMYMPTSLYSIDPRLPQYIQGVAEDSGVIEEYGKTDLHNVDEVAACCKFLRMFIVYDFDVTNVQRFIRMYETFKFSGLNGRQQYKMTPIQVFLTCGILGFVHKETGRRVVREAIAFIPRKFAKTTFLSALAMYDFLFGDANGEVHIVANSLSQAKIAFKETSLLAKQVDPNGTSIRFTAETFNMKEGQKRQNVVEAHTAGGRTKDGAFASLVLADEYGSASYVKDKCLMADAINVYESSMGPRLNPLTVITTTAGRVVEGPFEQKLRSAQEQLYKETDAQIGVQPNDWQFVLSLHPDAWEYTDECFSQERLHRKVNPHVGITVQSDFYKSQWEKAKSDPEVYKETVTKLFNQFVSNSSRPWIQAEDIRRLQSEKIHNVRQLSKDWLCFVGCDFSKGDDLCSLAYFCLNPKTKQYYFDCDAWIASEQMSGNTNSVLYRQWADKGFLHVSTGKTIDESDVLTKLDEVSRSVRVCGIGYDPFDSMRFVNLFREWLVGKLSGRSSAKKVEEAVKMYLQPVSQTWASFNSAVQVMWDIVNRSPQSAWVSANPMIPWCFGNCVLEEDKMGNVKPVKISGRSSKIDIAISLLMGVIMQERVKK